MTPDSIAQGRKVYIRAKVMSVPNDTRTVLVPADANRVGVIVSPRFPSAIAGDFGVMIGTRVGSSQFVCPISWASVHVGPAEVWLDRHGQVVTQELWVDSSAATADMYVTEFLLVSPGA